jgi:hypothetical protein
VKVSLTLGLLALLALELFLSAKRLSQTFDEGDHLLAGYRYWTCGDFGVNPEHPPLAKLLAALPLLLEKPAVPGPCGESRTTTAEDFALASEFLSKDTSDRLLFEARMAVASLSLLTALLVAWMARHVGGPKSALLSLAFFVFEPTVVAHSALVTTDMAVACFLLLSVLAWKRTLEEQSWPFLVLTGLGAGLALASKHSGVLVLPILALEAPLLGGGRLLRKAGALVFVVALAVLVLWASYGFRFDPRGGGHAMSRSLRGYIERSTATSGVDPKALGAVETLDRLRVLPESYLYGTANVLIGSAAGGHMYLFGTLYPTGRWFYFPATLLVKWTLGFMASLLLAIRFAPRGPRAVLIVPPLFWLLVSMTSRQNIGVRHLLPAFPFLLILAGLGCAALWERPRGRAVVLLLVLVHAGSSLRAFPDDLAYSNELFGGKTKTYRVLSDSNVDWGQGLKEARAYLESQGIRDCAIAYFGTATPARYGIPCRSLPPARAAAPVERSLEGTVLVSADYLAGISFGPGDLNPFEPFKDPVATIGGSLLVFRGRFDVPLLASLSHQERSQGLLEGHRVDEALAEARTASVLAPRNPFARRLLARVLAASGASKEAQDEYARALALAREGAEFHPRLVRSLEEEVRSASPSEGEAEPRVEARLAQGGEAPGNAEDRRQGIGLGEGHVEAHGRSGRGADVGRLEGTHPRVGGVHEHGPVEMAEEEGEGAEAVLREGDGKAVLQVGVGEAPPEEGVVGVAPKHAEVGVDNVGEGSLGKPPDREGLLEAG